MDDTRFYEEFGELKGDVKSIPAVVMQAMEPRLQKLKEEIIDDMKGNIERCQAANLPRINSLEQNNQNSVDVLRKVEHKQRWTGIAIGVLVLAFLGSFSGGAVESIVIPLLKGLFG